MNARGRFFLWSGVLLINLGLFLQAMNPSEFLLLALTSPWSTLQNHGLMGALFFWSGALALLLSLGLFLRPTKSTCVNEFDDGWSFL